MSRGQPRQGTGTAGRAMLARAKSDGAWALILAITAFFQFFRGAPVDGVVFTVACLALLVNIVGIPGVGRFHRPRPPRALVLSACVLVVAALVVLPLNSTADAIIVIAVGITAVPFMWAEPLPSGDEDHRDRLHARASQHAAARLERDAQDAADTAGARRAVRRAAALWAALGVALCLWEVAAFLLGLRGPHAEWAHPPLSDLIGPMLDDPVGRAICVSLWIAGGVALLRRGHPR